MCLEDTTTRTGVDSTNKTKYDMTTHLTYDIHDATIDAAGNQSMPYISLEVTIGRTTSTFTYDREYVLNLWLDDTPDEVAKILAYSVVDQALRSYLENDHDVAGLEMSKYIDAYEQTPEIRALSHSVYHAIKEFVEMYIDDDFADPDPDDVLEEEDDLGFYVSSYDSENGVSLVFSYGDIAHAVDIGMRKLADMMYYDPTHRRQMAYDIAANLVRESFCKHAGVTKINDWLLKHEMKQEYAKKMVDQIYDRLEQTLDSIKHNKMTLSEFEKIIGNRCHED